MSRARSAGGMTLADAGLLALLLAAAGVSFLSASDLMSPGSSVVVEVEGRTVWKLNLDHASRTTVRGSRGPLTVEVVDGAVAVTKADCPNRVCMKTGWRSRSGDIIVCVPNRTIIRILGKKREGVHAITG